MVLTRYAVKPRPALMTLALLAAVTHLSPVFAREYKGAELRTRESFLYGRFEVSYRASRGSGQTSTFFTYNDDYPNTPWNEIDIEIMGRYRDDVQFNTIATGVRSHVRHQYVDFDPGLDYHVYACEWTPDYVAWFIDGEEAARQTGDHIAALQYPQKIMMNIWQPAAAGWAGEFDERILPLFAWYDYVSYYSYTPGMGDSGTNGDFTLQWTDQFDSFDEIRWQKATHTFNGNNVDFIPENCVFADGKMILCLTGGTYTGHEDRNPPAVLWAAMAGDSVLVRFSEDVEETSAEETGNYTIPGLTILHTELQPDLQTVRLRVSGIVPERAYNLVCFNITDRSACVNRMHGQNTMIVRRPEISFPLRINCGSDQSQGGALTDAAWSHETNYGCEDGISYHTDDAVGGAGDTAMFSDWRQGPAAYRIRAPRGVYALELLFSEYYYEREGTRVFDLYIEGEKAQENLDVYREAGGALQAYRFSADAIAVTDGVIDIRFAADIDQPVISGVIVEQLSTAVRETGVIRSGDYRLGQNYPNPCNGSTVIPYEMQREGRVRLTVYDIQGRRVGSLDPVRQPPGSHEIRWDIAGPSGVYIYHLDIESDGTCWSDRGKMLLIR
ncbi:family 16 glycosylhydrolase [bacterium]|nr:family 16 glycosylhydrolase [bacterium]